jgi:hypothetical protein
VTESTTTEAFDWEAISALDQAGQNAEVAAAYLAIAKQDEPTRRAVLAKAIQSVYQMPDDRLRSMTEARLRAWIALPEEDAAVVGNSFESVMDEMPAAIAMRRVTVVQSVAFKLNEEELAHLQKIVPRVLGDAPLAAPSKAMGTGKPKPWWKFWAKE